LRWYSFVLESAAVIEVRVSGEQRAFVIFETLNARGLDLSTTTSYATTYSAQLEIDEA
jgi:hypothetical protein